MKSRILTLAVLFFAVTVTNIQAQGTSDVTVRANVVTTFTFGEFAGDDGEVNFGDVVPGVTPVLNASDVDASTNVGAGHSLASILLQGPDVEVTISYAPTVTLLNPAASGAVELEYLPSVFGADAVGGARSEIIAGGSQVTITDGDFYLWAGGTLQAEDGGDIPATAAGSYSGEFTITVDID
ncbi:hypothetical protein QLX67_08220 [Balneolaceae bacterium ANBcel3]|nr:hypothetical protein [Balneolaceae bacterium ANBcel3]